MVVIKNLVQENEETEGKGNEEDGEKSQDGEERQKYLEMFSSSSMSWSPERHLEEHRQECVVDFKLGMFDGHNE